jgi:colanic acid biosynthesis glycosyl transferase WcaI
MHILFLTDNFFPEGNAPATRTLEHAREWVKRGNKVTVITCVPNFPEGKIFDGYKNQWLLKECIDGIDVWRVKTYIASNEGFLKRTIDFLSFMISSFVFGLFTKKVDIVIGTSPQFFTVISSWALAKIKRAPFIFELRDIWPASITAVNAMRSGWLINLLEKLELFLYHQSDLIICVTQSFKLDLHSRGVPSYKIKVITNGVNLSQYKHSPKKNLELSESYNLKGKFVAGYIGTLGMAHALDSIIEAAILLKKFENIKILFVGGGSDRSRLVEMVKTKNLSNVIIIERQPKEKMQKIWSLCDLSIVSLKDTPLFSSVIPSKIFESMAMGIPILMSTPIGEATKIIQENKVGIVIPPENPLSLSQTILDLKKNKSKIQLLSKNAQLTANKFNRKILSVKMLDYLKETLS